MLPDFPVIIADESVDSRIIRNLEKNGFRIYSIADEVPGISDKRVMDLAIEKNGFIITEDKDFGDELVYRKTQSIGSMLLRVSDLPVASKVRLVVETIQHHADDLKDCFSVLTAKKLRIRKYT